MFDHRIFFVEYSLQFRDHSSLACFLRERIKLGRWKLSKERSQLILPLLEAALKNTIFISNSAINII
jgi:hypothetical protein